MLRGVSSALPPTTTFVLSVIEYKQAEKITFLHSCNVADLSTFACFAASLNTWAKAFVFMASGSQRADAPKAKIKAIDHNNCVSAILDAVAFAILAPLLWQLRRARIARHAPPWRLSYPKGSSSIKGCYVRFWQKADMARLPSLVRFRG